MKILVVARSAAEYRWALSQASKDRRGNSWWILQVGDIQVGTLPSASVSERIPTNCQLISLEDLKINPEQVWSEVKDLQSELWHITSTEPHKQLHLVPQWVVGIQLFYLAYLELAFEAGLHSVKPDRIQLPPAWTAKLSDPNTWTVGDAQWLMYIVARRHAITCSRHWSYVVKHNLGPGAAAVTQIALFILVISNDLTRIIKWLGAKLFRQTAAERGHKLSNKGLPEEPFVLANVDSDLERQFNVCDLSKDLASRCVAWITNPGRLIDFNNDRFQNEMLRLYALGKKKEADAIASQAFCDASRVAAQVFPTLVSTLVLRVGSAWQCNALNLRRPRGVSERLFRLLGTRGTAGARLLNYRRLVYAAKWFAMGCDVLKATRASLLVASDSIDIDRALTLSARSCGVRSLATSHGLEIRAEQVFNLYPLADVHCVFGKSSSVIGENHLPGVTTCRIVCHDSLINEIRPDLPDGPSLRRVLIVTGGIINYNLFVRQTAYAASLQALVDLLAKLKPAVEITFKAHPLYDHYDLYESLRLRFPATIKGVWRAPLMVDQAIPADVVVFFNYISTLFLTAVSQKLSILGHWGALTPLGRRLIRVANLSGSDDSREVARTIEELLAAPNGQLACATMRQNESVRDTFVEPSIGGLSEAINSALCADH